VGVSIIVPCLNEEKYIHDCLKSLIENGFSQSELEILVVDGGSTDKSMDIIGNLQLEFSKIRVIPNPKKKTPFALNLGIQHAVYEFILIAGAHAIYPKGYITELYKRIQQKEIDIVGGAIETKVKTENAKSNAIKFVLSSKFGVGNSQFRIGAKELVQVDTVPFGLYKKEVFEKSGLYNEKLSRNHDIELSRRIQQHGFNIWLDPALKVIYFARETYRGLSKNNYGNGYWNLRTLYITKRFKSLSLRHYIPLLFLLSIIAPVIFSSIFHSGFMLVSLLSLLLYVFLIAYLSFSQIKQQNPFYLFWAFIALHFAYGFGSLSGALSPIKFWKK
jgi:glycosyltransferase involved in cell wall biosynthesis